VLTATVVLALVDDDRVELQQLFGLVFVGASAGHLAWMSPRTTVRLGMDVVKNEAGHGMRGVVRVNAAQHEGSRRGGLIARVAPLAAKSPVMLSSEGL